MNKRITTRVTLFCTILMIYPTIAWATEEIKKDTVGPWEIEAAFKNDKFDHCAIRRKIDEVSVSFIRTNDALSLELQSPNWKLDRGKNYPVHMKAGVADWNTEVAAESDSSLSSHRRHEI